MEFLFFIERSDLVYLQTRKTTWSEPKNHLELLKKAKQNSEKKEIECCIYCLQKPFQNYTLSVFYCFAATNRRVVLLLEIKIGFIFIILIEHR